MDIITNNPFRVLGIPVNAGAKDLAANKGKMKLLEIGKEVSFPLDLPNLLSQTERTTEKVTDAERKINLPNDKIHHALFWFAKPSDTIGAFGYERLLAGEIDDAVAKLEKSNSWEAKLCLATICLVNNSFQEALCYINCVIEQHCEEFSKAIAGQTYVTKIGALRGDYLSALSSEVGATKLYLNLSKSETPKPILDGLRDMAIAAPISEIEEEIAIAKAVNVKSISAQLQAGKNLKAKTQNSLQLLKNIVGINDIRYSRIADKLANQILQCSINYFNAHKDETRIIINNALALGVYAQTIVVGNIARDHIKHNVDILRKKLENLPPAEVESDVNAIMRALEDFVAKPDRIDYSITLLKTTRPYLQNIKITLGATNSFYLKLSTRIVDNATHNLIEEVNATLKMCSPNGNANPILFLSIGKPVIDKAWNATEIMDGFDMEDDFRRNRYMPNRNSLKSLYDTGHNLDSQVKGRTSGGYSGGSNGGSSGGCYIATMVYGDYDHPQVMVLRGFRDDVLQQCILGRAFVRYYYKHSPIWVEHLKNKKRINTLIRKILDGFIKIYKHEK